jgi:hypothetical protein
VVEKKWIGGIKEDRYGMGGVEEKGDGEKA